MARARELESEERTGLRQPRPGVGDFLDDPDEHAATATLLRDDQIDFRDENGSHTYSDEYTDNGVDVFRFGEGDEEEGIGMDKHAPRGR